MSLPEPLSARHASSAHRDIVSLALVSLLVVTLVGSVVIPAIESRRITRLLNDITYSIEPARLQSLQLESGMSLEYSALQSYALFGDSALLTRYRAVAAGNDRVLASIERLAPQLGPAAVTSVAEVRRRLEGWHQLNRALVTEGLARHQLALDVRGQRVLRDSIVDAVDRLPTALSDQILAQREEVIAHERQSILVNAALVLAAMAGLVLVIALLQRQRRLGATLQRRAEYEAALRETSEALAEAFTMGDVTEQIVRSARNVTRARCAWFERVESAPDGSSVLVVRGVAGDGAPPVGTARPYDGSYAQSALVHNTPMYVAQVEQQDPPASGSKIVLPIDQLGRPIGAVCVVDAAVEDWRSSDRNWARIFAHLAALAYEKVRLLDEARDARRELERVMTSRERLVRGFSHDLKNPLGAADGYAELLIHGIFGEMTATQRESLESLRRSIHRALGLIDDLHELARAESGVVALRRESVHVGELVRSLYEEYRGAAHASGLALGVDAASEVPVLVTDGGRLRQIVGNLLSNAIKYTTTGSVTLRARTQALAQGSDGGGWVYLDVIDTGIGIPVDKRAMIFEEFSRLGDGDKPGAGLGLAISERLAEALGGRILVESEIGAGSTFTVQLPLA